LGTTGEITLIINGNATEKFISIFSEKVPYAECYFCGKVYITSNINYITNEELDNYRKLGAESPNKYFVTQDYSLIDTFKFLDEIAVIGCKCGADVNIEKWVNDHKDKLQAYIA